MSATSGGPGGPGDPGGEYEVVIHGDRRHIWAARARVVGRELAHGSAVAGRTAARAAGHGGRTGLVRLRAYLRTPEGRHAAVRTAQAVGAAAALVGAVVLVRGRLQSLARGAGVLGAGWRAVTGAARAVTQTARAAAGAIGAAVRATQLGVPLRWLAAGLRWLTRSRRGGPRRRVHCPDCHARVRADAHVCYRCGYRPSPAPAGHRGTLGDAARHRRALAGAVTLLWRLLAQRRFRACPDCRRRLHADARVCAHCGYRPAHRPLSPRPAPPARSRRRSSPAGRGRGPRASSTAG